MNTKEKLLKESRTDYSYTNESNFHKKRARYILKHYPQVKKLMKSYPLSSLYVILIVGLQIILGAWVATMPWWVMLTVAFFIGAVASHALFVLLHETVHQLIFKNKTTNKLIAILISVGQGVPTGVSFGEFHLEHHLHMGDYEQDPDIPLANEANLVKNIAPLKAIWLICMGFVQAFRPIGRPTQILNKWSLTNLAVVMISNLLIAYFMGWYALLYILISTFFGLGMHPLGARWIQEHFVFREGQETYSYYGIGNKFTFNIGYHNEHHDLMGIPWVNLPKLKKMVPELYEPLYAHTSWIKLYFRFIFDKRIYLFNRMVRAKAQ